FQAEDGIRDFHVTGVQTCALPILGADGTRRPMFAPARVRGAGNQLTASRRPLPGLKPGRRAAAICRVAPVCGLRPSRAARSFTAKVPKPTSETLSPLRSALVMVSVRASRARAAVDLGRSAEAAMASISSALFMRGTPV